MIMSSLSDCIANCLWGIKGRIELSDGHCAKKKKIYYKLFSDGGNPDIILNI